MSQLHDVLPDPRHFLSHTRYGDLLPSTAVSRMSVCIFILLAIIIVPMRINIVVEKFGILSKYAGVYKRQTKKHVVVTGIFDHKSLRTFLCEFFSSQRGYTCCRVCILGTAYPDKEMQLLLQGRLASERTQYLHGSPTNAQDLHRAQVHSAVAIFIMTDKATPDEQVKHVDALNILTTISMRQFNDTVPIYVQVRPPPASKGGIRLAPHRRRRGGGVTPPLDTPPDQSDHRGKKRKLTIGKIWSGHFWYAKF